MRLTLEELEQRADSISLYRVLVTKVGRSARHLITALRFAVYVTTATCTVSRIRKTKLGLQQSFAKRLFVPLKPIPWKFPARHENPRLAAERRF